jgi:hypothetical protein
MAQLVVVDHFIRTAIPERRGPCPRFSRPLGLEANNGQRASGRSGAEVLRRVGESSSKIVDMLQGVAHPPSKIVDILRQGRRHAARCWRSDAASRRRTEQESLKRL